MNDLVIGENVVKLFDMRDSFMSFVTVQHLRPADVALEWDVVVGDAIIEERAFSVRICADKSVSAECFADSHDLSRSVGR